MALLLSALMHVPWPTVTTIAIAWSVLGITGFAYTVIVARRMARQPVYKPVFEDWLCHVAGPLIAYAALAISSIAVRSWEREALFGVGGAALLLLFAGIHNAWDSVAYHVLVMRAGAEKPHRDNAK